MLPLLNKKQSLIFDEVITAIYKGGLLNPKFRSALNFMPKKPPPKNSKSSDFFGGLQTPPFLPKFRCLNFGKFLQKIAKIFFCASRDNFFLEKKFNFT